MNKNKSLLLFVAILIFFVGSISVAACNPASSSGQSENSPEPTTALTEEINQGPVSTEIFKPTVIPDFTTEAITATDTSLPTKITDAFDVEMMLVPAGEFTMGENPDVALAECQKWRYDCGRDESIGPIHQVYLDAFYMDKYEVTNAFYRACVNAGMCQEPNKTNSHTRSDYFENPEFDDYPVIYVEWEMANTFCEWREARLPTEAEWEKAARGTDGRTYPWGEDKPGCDYANLAQMCKGDTSKVGVFIRDVSPYGIFDMAGNVSEWVADWYSEFYYEITPFENPPGPEVGEVRVLRGDYWLKSKITPEEGKIYFRGVDRVNSKSDYYLARGFRCARDASP